MAGTFWLRVFDVEHGACALMVSPTGERIAMIDSGHNTATGFRPSAFISLSLKRTTLDYLFITNADQDHLSDLEGLWESGIDVRVAHRNRSPEASILRTIKEKQGELTNDVERFLKIHAEYAGPVPVAFNEGMGGVEVVTFANTYPQFQDTNNLSQVVFIKYAGISFLFPGDLEKDGWRALLQNPKFVAELLTVDVLMASHHGRTNGYSEDAFKFCQPRVVVISDKPIAHSTQETVPDYRCIIKGDGVSVRNLTRLRHVLTTRRDGDITFTVDPSGNGFWIDTSKR